jgi:hypothetical protein
MTGERGDSGLEHALAEWLEEEAAPMPDALRAAIDEVPSRHGPVGRGRWLDSSWGVWRVAAGTAAAGLLLIAIVAGPGVLDRLREAAGRPSGSVASPGEVLTWDMMLSFRDMNPAQDGYGHAVVWTYLSGPAGVRDSAQFRLLPVHEGPGDGVWSDPAIPGLSVGPAEEESVRMMPSGGGSEAVAAIVAWRNPIGAVPLTLTGSVEVDGSCGDGILLAIDHAGDTFKTIQLSRGSEQFSISLERFDPGEVIHFIVEPGASSECDATWLEAVITSP